MAKAPTYPTLYDEVLKVNISKLKEWGYLNPDQTRKGIITWSTDRNQTGSISIRVSTQREQPYIELDYKYMDKPRIYKVHLVSMPSNLGNGLIWYFLCPQTKKRCRTLYCIEGYFLHREAHQACMYRCQTRSKSQRHFDKIVGSQFGLDDLYSELESKYFKMAYAGKQTKRAQRILAQIEMAESISYRTILQVLA